MRSNLILYLRFGIIVGLRSHLLPSEEKYVQGKSSQSKISSCTYTCVLCTHIRIYVCRDLVHQDSLGPPGVSSRPLGSYPSTPSVQCVCVCAYTHTYTHIHSHLRQ